MATRRTILLAGVLSVVMGWALALPGCGGGAQETGPDGQIKLAPGTIDPSKESPVPPKAGR